MTSDAERVPRYSYAVRVTHWAVALAWVLLFTSGLALFHPYFFWLSALFGGGEFMRVLHPFLGVGIAALFFAYAAGIWRDNLLLESDRTWIRRALEVMTKKVDLPVEGKYNAGQKVLFWVMLVSIAALLGSGFFLWRPYFAPSFTANTRRIAALVHVAFFLVMIVGIGVHIYAAYWTKGSIAAMTRGYVSRAWARKHHPGWYAQVASAERADPGRRA
jgi:formate dehydrogenase subunit gamma